MQISKQRPKLCVIIFLLVFSVLIFFRFFLRNPELQSPSFLDSYSVTFGTEKENIDEIQILLTNPNTNETKTFGTIPDVYTEHYHPAEFVNGELYLIRRIGDIGRPNNWTDQLWKYKTSDDGVMLYEAQGIDFRVSPDGNSLAVFAGSFPTKVSFLNNDGNELYQLQTSRLGLTDAAYSLQYLAITNETLWLGTTQGVQLMFIYAFVPSTDVLREYAVAGLGMTSHEFDIQPDRSLVVYSDYTFAFDTDNEQSLQDSPNSLFLYDLQSGVKTPLLTSNGRHAFVPKWIDDSTVEYNDPENNRRQITVK